MITIDPAKKAAKAVTEAKAAAVKLIGEIRAELSDHLATIAVGTPAEQGQAKTALGLLRAELALQKTQLQ